MLTKDSLTETLQSWEGQQEKQLEYEFLTEGPQTFCWEG